LTAVVPKIGMMKTLSPAATGTISSAFSSSEMSSIVTSVGGFSGERTCSKRPTGTRTLAPDNCTTGRRVDLVTEPFDVAIRMGEPPDSNLIARRLASLPGRVYATPRYLELSGEPAHPADLARHECIGFPKSGIWTLHNDAQTVDVTVGGRFVLNSVGMIRRLAKLDMGIILLPEQVVAENVANDRLRHILQGWQGASVSVYAITETRLLPGKTQRFIEFLRERLEQTIG
jgi:DNA-binding transcriptional LysR family regulator